MVLAPIVVITLMIVLLTPAYAYWSLMFADFPLCD
jgi:hypothetical protein